MKVQVRTLLFFFSLWLTVFSHAQCPPGDVILSTQTDVGDFVAAYPDCSEIDGWLRIRTPIDETDYITDISGLINITKIGRLWIHDESPGPDRLSLHGLENLTEVTGDVELSLLNNLHGLEGLITVGGDLEILGIAASNLRGLDNLNSIGGRLVVSGCVYLTDLSGLENLLTIGEGFGLSDNSIAIEVGEPFLDNFDGLDNLTSIGGSIALSNSGIRNFTGLESLTSIGGIYMVIVPDFTEFTGLENVTSINGDITIHNCFCSIPNFTGLENVTHIGGNFSVGGIVQNNFQGLNSLVSIDGDFRLSLSSVSNLNGLENLTYVGGQFWLQNNPQLSDACALIPLLDGVDDGAVGPGTDPIPDVGGEVSIENNAPGSNSLDEIFAPPVAVCKNMTVTFDAELTKTLDPAGLWDEEASTTNCSSLWVADYIPSTVSCDEIGSTIPVTLTVMDNGGKTATCTANVTVDGITCGWADPEDGVGCPDGSSGDFSEGTFTVSSAGCFDPSFYSDSDVQGMLASELCGDGEIIAQVTNVDGSGFGGISMRESMSPFAKKLQLMIDGVMLTRRELRNSTGGLAFAHVFQTQGKNWLRLTRTGNMFSAYHSSDGASWSAVLITTIDMATCISVGLMAKSNSADDIVEATFEHVFITGLSGSLAELPASFDIAQETSTEKQVHIYPNPATDELFIDLSKFQGKGVHIQVLNGQQQMVQELDWAEVTQSTRSLDISRLVDGVYYLRILSEEQQVTQKFVKVN